MNYENIAQVYEANNKISEKLNAFLQNLSTEDAEIRTSDGEGWTIREIVEHIAIVEVGIAKISAKLLSASESQTNEGKAKITKDFLEKANNSRHEKLKAPDLVAPTGEKTIAESLEKMSETAGFLNELRPRFETVELSDATFPHPYFGAMNAHEWLALIGGHKIRHLEQIKKILEENKQN